MEISRTMGGGGNALSIMAGNGRLSTALLPRSQQGIDGQPSPAMALRAGASLSPTLTQAAQDFETLAIAQLLQPVFDTVDTAHGPFGGGEAEATWKPMLVEAIAKQVATHGGLGFAGPVFHALLRAQEAQAGTPTP